MWRSPSSPTSTGQVPMVRAAFRLRRSARADRSGTRTRRPPRQDRVAEQNVWRSASCRSSPLERAGVRDAHAHALQSPGRARSTDDLDGAAQRAPAAQQRPASSPDSSRSSSTLSPAGTLDRATGTRHGHLALGRLVPRHVVLVADRQLLDRLEPSSGARHPALDDVQEPDPDVERRSPRPPRGTRSASRCVVGMPPECARGYTPPKVQRRWFFVADPRVRPQHVALVEHGVGDLGDLVQLYSLSS